MTTIHHEIEAACPAERIWAVLSDLEAVQTTTRRSAPLRCEATADSAWVPNASVNSTSAPCLSASFGTAKR